MSNYYLLFLPQDVISKNVSYDQPRINLNVAAAQLQVDDKILLVQNEHGSILPFVYTVTYVNRGAGTLTLQREEFHNRAIGWGEVIKVLDTLHPQFASSGTANLNRDDFEQIVGKMGGKRMEEKALLEHIQSYIRARGYYFEDETLYNYHICLKTRPFIILAGLSGTGKSKLSQLYAEALGHKSHYMCLPVRPNWNDDRYLLGYLNTLTGEYSTEPAVEFIMEANEDQDNLYFFCLDEMNLAHVEYYFSQFLSAMEGEQADERQIRLYGKRMQKLVEEQNKQVLLYGANKQKLLEEQDKTPTVPAQLLLPDNLFFTGTINVDETTQSLSDKVIDRANTLEFFNVDLEKIPQPTTPPDPVPLSTYTWQSYCVSTPDTSYRTQIIEISKILNKADLGLGYRVLHEIEVYLANSKELLAPLAAFDLQVKQRILPRIRGNEAISDMIKELQNYFKQNKLERSQKRLQEMEKRLKRDGYTNFWR
jgi:energy-coupling factor transporter ATP-binding protein EcfA2